MRVRVFTLFTVGLSPAPHPQRRLFATRVLLFMALPALLVASPLIRCAESR